MADVCYSSTPGEYDAQLGDYFALLKPRVMSLVVFTALVGLLAAPGSVHPVVAFSSILFVAIGAGASGAANKPTKAVNTTSDMTRGLSKAK